MRLSSAHEHADPLRPLGDVVVDAEQRLGGEARTTSSLKSGAA